MSRRSPLVVVFFTIFLDLLAFGLILPVTPYYALSFHARESQIGMLGTAFSIMQLLCVPLWGRLSDRIGRRPVLLISTIGSAASMTCFGAAQSLAWLFAARLLAGAMTANIATAQAYIADVTKPEERAKGMGLVGAAFGLGFILGPFVGGELAELGRTSGIGLGLVGYGAGALSLLNFLLAYRWLPESLPSEKRQAVTKRSSAFREILSSNAMPPLLAVVLASAFAFSNMEWTFGLLTRLRLGWEVDHGGARANGLVFAYIGIIGAILQGALIGRLTRRFGEKALLLAGLASMALGLLSLAAMTTIPRLMVSVTLISIGNGLSMPSLSSLVSQHAPKDRQGAALGVQQSTSALARVVGPTSGGLLFEHVSSSAPFFMAGAMMFFAFFLASLGLRRLSSTRTSLHSQTGNPA